jgi:drug/metabolite transporter (DMT)-like permease
VAAAAGAVGLLLASVLYNTGMARVPVRVAGMSLNLIPVFGAAASVVLLGEHITVGQASGGALVLAGLIAFPYGREEDPPGGPG